MLLTFSIDRTQTLPHILVHTYKIEKNRIIPRIIRDFLLIHWEYECREGYFISNIFK